MRTTVTLILAALGAVPLHAQTEEALKTFFEGRSVVVRIDMPANTSGVDVYPEHEQPLDFGKHASRLRQYGVAVREGDRILVTKVKVKDDLIEFQLGGGGFSTFHDSSGSVSMPSVEKSSREKELEREVKGESDAGRKRRLQRELDDLRHDREREEARNRVVAEAANEVRRERDRQRALTMGSRFNIRFDKDVPPPALNPEGVMRALAAYVEFPGGPRPPQRPEDLRMERPGSAEDGLRKGMTRDEVEDLLGRPQSVDERTEGRLEVTVAVYASGPDRVEATFLEGVLVRYRVTAR